MTSPIKSASTNNIDPPIIPKLISSLTKVHDTTFLSLFGFRSFLSVQVFKDLESAQNEPSNPLTNHTILRIEHLDKKTVYAKIATKTLSIALNIDTLEMQTKAHDVDISTQHIIKRVNECLNVITFVRLLNQMSFREISNFLKPWLNINSQDDQGLTILHHLILSTRLEYNIEKFQLIDKVLNLNPDINIQDCKGNTPLHYCLGQFIARDVYEKITKRGGRGDLRNDEGMTPLDLISNLVEEISISQTNYQRFKTQALITLLMDILGNVPNDKKALDLIVEIVSKNPNPNILYFDTLFTFINQKSNDFSALPDNYFKTQLKLILRNASRKYTPPSPICIPLLLNHLLLPAIQNKNIQETKESLTYFTYEFEFLPPNNTKKSILDYAKETNDSAILHLITRFNEMGKLWKGIKEWNASKVQEALNTLGPDFSINEGGIQKTPALARAVDAYIELSDPTDTEIFKLLMQQDEIDVNILSPDATITPLIFSIMHLDTELFSLFLNKGANVDLPNKDKNTPLIFLIEEYDESEASEKILSLLLDSDPDINAKNKLGESAILRATKKNSETLVKAILKKHPDRNEVLKCFHKTSSYTVQVLLEDYIDETEFESPDKVKAHIESISDDELYELISLPLICTQQGQDLIITTEHLLIQLTNQLNHYISYAEEQTPMNPLDHVEDQIIEKIPAKFCAVAINDRDHKPVILHLLSRFNESQLRWTIPSMNKQDLLEHLSNTPINNVARYLSFATTEQKIHVLENWDLAKSKHLSNIKQGEWTAIIENAKSLNDHTQKCKEFDRLRIAFRPYSNITSITQYRQNVLKIKKGLLSKSSTQSIQELVEEKINSIFQSVDNELECIAIINKVLNEEFDEFTSTTELAEKYIDPISTYVMENPYKEIYVEFDSINNEKRLKECPNGTLDLTTWMGSNLKNPFTNVNVILLIETLNIDNLEIGQHYIIPDTNLKDEIQNVIVQQPNPSFPRESNT